MNELIQLGKNITIADLIVIIAAASFVVQIGMKVINYIITKYKEKQNTENLSTTVEQLSVQIQKDKASIDQKIDELTVEILNLSEVFNCRMNQFTKRIEDDLNESRAYRKAILHDSIIKMYDDYIARGYITHSELENFSITINQYYKAGGNGLIKSKYEPAIMELPVKENSEEDDEDDNEQQDV